MDPINALLVGFIILAVITYVFWPQKGLIAVWKRTVWNAEKILMEDALKLFYQYEEKQIVPTTKTVEEELSISFSKTKHIIKKLKQFKLIELRDDKINMTEEGRNYSLQIIRNHRLWERFLADETAVKEIDWHIEAEHAEHKLSPEQADELAAKIGNPLIDPHGDPIPTSDGIMPERSGKPITELRDNEFAEIIHLEDEPLEIYKDLVDEGIYPGMYIQMKGKSKGHILFIANGKGFKIKTECGNNVFVSSIVTEVELGHGFKSLSTLKVGESGKIFGISNAVRGKQRRRLLDFGIIPGTEISADLVSFSGDPIAYNIRGTSIALRKEQTDLIFIEDEINE